MTNAAPIESTYTKWQREEGVPVHTGFWADLNAVEVAPWERKGCLGAYVNLADQESLDAYVAEIPGGGQTKVQRHMYEETIYVLAGRGATTLWYDGIKKHTFEWQEGSLFALPLNCWYQHFNGQADQPVRYVAVTTAPLCINLFHSKDFVYNNHFVFKDRVTPIEDPFSGKGFQKTRSIPDSANSPYRSRVCHIWKTNFIPDVPRFDQLTDHNRDLYTPGASRSIDIDLCENTMSGHIADINSGFYKKAHRHGAGAHLIVIRGSGYSLIWEEGKERTRVDWKAGIMFSPANMWYHNHFSTGKEPARHLALRWSVTGDYLGIIDWKRYSENYGEQIEYADEDPEIRKEFGAECRKNGVEVRMPPVTYRGRGA